MTRHSGVLTSSGLQSDHFTPFVPIFLLLVLLLWIRYPKLAAMSKIPGPWYSKFTTAVVKYHEFSGTKRRWVHQLHLKYGPVVQLGRNEVSFASFTGARQIYSSRHREFRKTKLYSLFEQDGQINLFTALDHQMHSQIRRQLAEKYSNSLILKSGIIECLAERAEMFVQACAKVQSADIYLYLHAYALDCVTVMLFHPFGSNSLCDNGDMEMVRFLSYSSRRGMLFFFHYFPTLARLYEAVLSRFTNTENGDNLIRSFVRQSLSGGSHSGFTLANRLMGLEDFSRSLMEAECLDHIGAGVETTGDTLCWLIWELSQPRSQGYVDKLHEELINAERGQYSEDLPYLGAIIQEALRLWAPGTQPLPRYAPKEGAQIDGYYLPGDTIVGSTSYSMHRLDETVFPDPDDFVPERWLKSEGSVERQRLFFAFGIGPRTCIGKHLAMAEMRACLKAIYSRYKTRPAADMNSSMEMDDQVLTSRPRGMRCKVKLIFWEEV